MSNVIQNTKTRYLFLLREAIFPAAIFSFLSGFDKFGVLLWFVLLVTVFLNRIVRECKRSEVMFLCIYFTILVGLLVLKGNSAAVLHLYFSAVFINMAAILGMRNWFFKNIKNLILSEALTPGCYIKRIGIEVFFGVILFFCDLFRIVVGGIGQTMMCLGLFYILFCGGILLDQKVFKMKCEMGVYNIWYLSSLFVVIINLLWTNCLSAESFLWQNVFKY